MSIVFEALEGLPIAPLRGIAGRAVRIQSGHTDGTGAASRRWVEVAPGHPHVRYVGRVDWTNRAAPAFAFPGVSVRLRFLGEGLDVRLRDHGGRTPETTNYYAVVVDGGPAAVLETSPDRERYTLADGLAEGPHMVEMVKRTESGPVLEGRPSGRAEILGFSLRGNDPPLPIAPASRRIEVVGDSISCGYGNELASSSSGVVRTGTRRSNAHMTFGAIAARQLGAEVVSVAYSGRGLCRNFAGAPGATLPEIYDATLPDDPAAPAWDVSLYRPDAVVINLGTNDHSPGGLDRDLFKRRYLSFLVRLRRDYPEAILIASVGPMLRDDLPPGTSAWTELRSDVREVVAHRHGAGDTAVHYLEFPPQSPPYGEDGHPTVATHLEMAGMLSQLIGELLGWSPM